jgi:regulator of protease activity HflC (stomatin/prohibitin superfamily)
MSITAGAILVVCILVALMVTLAASSIRILREYERAVVFRLGRLLGEKGPGLVLLIPVVDRMVRVDLRTVTLAIPPQNLITRDNVPAKVNAVCYFRVIDAARAVVAVEQFLMATSQIAQTTLRSVLGKAELDMLLCEREQLNEALQHIIDEHTDPWGIKVTTVEIKDVEIPQAMQRAMALGAEAERERRAKIIHAEGEFQASQRLRDAADVIAGNPASLQLRYLQTLTEIGSTQNSTVVFPLPLDVVKPFLEVATAARAANQVDGGTEQAAVPEAGARAELADGTSEPETGNGRTPLTAGSAPSGHRHQRAAADPEA